MSEFLKIILNIIVFYGITYSGHRFWSIAKEGSSLKFWYWIILAWIGLAIFTSIQ